jgi:DEAD/DEAH box helicase domain-containing protein
MECILVFDLETKRLADEVGGWSHIDKMGFAAGVTYDVLEDAFERFTEERVDRLIDLLYRADRIIGFNLLRFDFTVLRPYGFKLTQAIREKTTDLMIDIYNALGFRVGLDNLAAATLGEAKSADGLAAVKWFREGNIDLVLNYCEQDVRVTSKLWEFGVQHGYLLYTDRRGRPSRIKVNCQPASSLLNQSPG